MIVLLNFAPIAFMGGAEKWMHETALRIRKHEEVVLVSVASEIADIYGQIVLKRKFEKRAKEKIENNISLAFVSFIPFSDSWKKAKKYFQKARVIYAKYEVLELLIIIYFLGFPGLKKTIAGIHSPFMYATPDSFFGKLHNRVYESVFSRKTLAIMKKVHVLNKKDENIIKDRFHVENVVYVPNGVDVAKYTSEKKTPNEKTLRILFVGELSKRKGVDILLDLIKKAPQEYLFTIAGDGPLKPEIQRLSKRKKNCIYRGFIGKNEMEVLYSQNDILILPSRAESMSLAVLEALSHGLIIVDAKEVSLDLEKNIEYSVMNTPGAYLQVLAILEGIKRKKGLNRQAVISYFKENFSSDVTYPQLLKKIFVLPL